MMSMPPNPWRIPDGETDNFYTDLPMWPRKRSKEVPTSREYHASHMLLLLTWHSAPNEMVTFMIGKAGIEEPFAVHKGRAVPTVVDKS